MNLAEILNPDIRKMSFSEILNPDYKKTNLYEIINPGSKYNAGNSLQASQTRITLPDSTFAQNGQKPDEADFVEFKHNKLEDRKGADARSSRQTPDKTFMYYELRQLGKHQRSAVKCTTTLWENKHAGILHLERTGDWKVACYSWWDFLLANYARASEIETWEKTRIQDTYLAVRKAMNLKGGRPNRETMADDRSPGPVRPLASLASYQFVDAHSDGVETFNTIEDEEAIEWSKKDIERKREKLETELEEIARHREDIIWQLKQVRRERQEVKIKERRLKKKARRLEIKKDDQKDRR